MPKISKNIEIFRNSKYACTGPDDTHHHKREMILSVERESRERLRERKRRKSFQEREKGRL